MHIRYQTKRVSVKKYAAAVAVAVAAVQQRIQVKLDQKVIPVACKVVLMSSLNCACLFVQEIDEIIIE